MTADHSFCRELLKEARKEASRLCVNFTGLTAIRTSSLGMNKCYFVECPDFDSQYERADCTADAKQKFIMGVLKRKEVDV